MRTLISRSLHTQQLFCRAARCLARPHSSRRVDAGLLSGRTRLAASAVRWRENSSPFCPHIVTYKPLPGLAQTLTPQEIRDFLALLGPSAVYGLRTIRLRQECWLYAQGITFAEYVVPGEIHLYAVPVSPWHLPFVPCLTDREAFARYEAQVTVDTARNHTTVVWEVGGLKSYLLYEVLAHEIGHHILQHNKGKRQAQICRRFDHEACADLYSQRIRRLRAKR